MNVAAISRMKKALGGKYTCYVLIACSTPAENGNMDVEMHFEGDETLAAFLVENASQAFEERQGLQESGC